MMTSTLLWKDYGWLFPASSGRTATTGQRKSTSTFICPRRECRRPQHYAAFLLFSFQKTAACPEARWRIRMENCSSFFYSFNAYDALQGPNVKRAFSFPLYLHTLKSKRICHSPDPCLPYFMHYHLTSEGKHSSIRILLKEITCSYRKRA